MGRFSRFFHPGPWTAMALALAYLLGVGLGFYEMTAKSPYLLDEPLPRNANGKFIKREIRDTLDIADAQ